MGAIQIDRFLRTFFLFARTQTQAIKYARNRTAHQQYEQSTGHLYQLFSLLSHIAPSH